ncbi:HlyD family secretion protein [Calidifontibacillus oryziterrae]|uniref:HlyD family secretion protein n=1 Tax=Calidifontibacillus oryziterrae TaxID=1191699 RepID=UPI00031E42DF|nr:HlyD family efflux transporter periplasmic adaptor subunit [Calidifontibacillus oryziterrae]
MKKMLLSLLAIIIVATGCSAKVSSLFGKDQLTLTGDIQNNIISATSTVAGKIIEMNKAQGETVKKGDVIAVIDNTNQKYTVDQLQAVVDLKKAKLEELQAGTRLEQIEQAEAQVRAAKAKLDLITSGTRKEQIAQAKNSVAIAEEAVKSMQLTYDHIETQYKKTVTLYNEGAVSQNQLDQAKLELDTKAKQLASTKYQLETAKQQLALLENGATPEEINATKANYDAAVAQLKLLESGATKQTIDAAKADLEQSIAQLNVAKNNLANSTITALADGIIVSKNFELGDVAGVGSNIADIAIQDDVYVLCYLPNEYLDKISYNQELTVITSLGEQTGKVSYIDLHHEYTPKDKQSTSDGKRIATKIKVAIDDHDGKLKNGMTADVIIPLNE